MKELPSDLLARVRELAAAGDELAARKDYTAAFHKYSEAWTLVPGPKHSWEASTWLLAAMGDACFLCGNFEPAIQVLSQALHCPGGSDNPFLHLRLGQCEFERGNTAAAAGQLRRAYELQGRDIFAAEDPKYFAFLEPQLASSSPGG